MYVILIIAFSVLLPTWILLRRLTRIWIERPITVFESILSGIAAWLFLCSILTWFIGIYLTISDFFLSHEVIDIGIAIFSILITGYVVDFSIRSKSEISFDDIRDFLKEAIQFRRSSQRRLDLLSLIHVRRKQKQQHLGGKDSQSLQRARLQANLNKEKELDGQLELLREGTEINISEVWRLQTKTHTGHSLYEKVETARVDPHRRRLSMHADFPEMNQLQLKDETNVLRLNRQVYDFLQSLNAEPWLKPYISFFDSYYLICRATRINDDGMEILYPFMKIGVLVSELRKLEGSYFNPRKLSEIAAIAFSDGAPV